jgi:protein gp37
MGETTEISWTDHTFNPWAGCTKVSPECDNCYAEKDTNRRGFVKWGKDATRRRTSEWYWNQLGKWNRAAQSEGIRRRVFIGSWCDIMEDNSQLAPIRADLYPRIETCESLDLLLLTKRPQNFRRFFPLSWIDSPLPNVWGMTTVGTADYRWRIDALRETPFAIRGLSMEPLLGPIGDLDLRGIHWVIVGGESQHGARAMHPDWAREIRDQCVAAGVAFHFKQWGEHNSDLIHIGKKKAGRLLDGREWNEFPR